MDFSHPVDPNDPGHGPTTIALTWVFTTLAISVVALRIYLRRKFSRYLHTDDWIMVTALGFQIAYSALLTKACLEGLGMTFANMTAHQLEQTLKWAFIILPFTHVISVLARVSITILLVKIFGQSKPKFKWFLIVYTSIQVIFGIISVVLALADEFPVATQWDLTLKPTRALNPVVQENIAETLQFLYAVCDLTYVIFPVLFVWKLQMPLHRKLGLIVLLGLSMITFAAAFSKAVVVALALDGKFPMTGPDFNGLYFWISTIEQCLVISIGCVPTLKPVTRLQFPMFTAIGVSIASLISRRSRSGKGSSTGGSSYREDFEMGPKDRQSDEEAFASSDRVERINTIQGNKSSSNLRKDDQIRRTDEIKITYAK